MYSEANRDRVIIQTSFLGIMANVFLAAFKAAIGFFTHSIAISLDAVNNLSDVLSSVITIIGTKLAGRQPDRDHPWGHGRAEYLSDMLISVLVLYAGITSMFESVKKIISPERPEYTKTALIIIFVGVIVKVFLGRHVKGVGERVNSESLVDSGQDALMDAIISASTLLAAIIFLAMGISLEAPLAAAISLVIIKSGYDMLRQTISEILGERVDVETAREVKRFLNDYPEVHGVYDLIFHDYGPGRLNCSAHVEVDDTLSALEIDGLQRRATFELYEKKGIIMTALSVYAINTRDEEVVKLRADIRKLVLGIDNVMEMHGFYVKGDEVLFDVIVSFDAKDRVEVYDRVCETVKKAYPGYRFRIVLDTDFS